ncbi:signal peptidase I [Enterococcus innesii]|uniref:signal peptidase I n=1 Tax=Enterococcus innesii TaxID=2839759 RepID=UPI003B59914A
MNLLESMKKKIKFTKKEITVWLLIIAVLVFFRLFILSPIKVSGSSMEPTLKNNDHCLVLKTAYSLSTGDTVVFKDTQSDKFLIKRVIAMEGDTVKIENDSVTVNGEKLNEPYLITYPENTDFTYGNGVIESNIKADTVYVLGDNRLISKDSRIIGSINKNQILGKVILSYSFNLNL